jgi:hypothetical protein
MQPTQILLEWDMLGRGFTGKKGTWFVYESHDKRQTNVRHFDFRK